MTTTARSLRHVLAVTGALADPNRVRVVLALGRGTLCVCQVTELLQLAPSTVSRHLSVLRHAGLVEARKNGRWMYYFIPDSPDPAVRTALEWLRAALARDPAIAEDVKRLERVLQLDPEELCRRRMERPRSCSSAPATRAAARWPKAGRATSGTA